MISTWKLRGAAVLAILALAVAGCQNQGSGESLETLPSIGTESMDTESMDMESHDMESMDDASGDADMSEEASPSDGS